MLSYLESANISRICPPSSRVSPFCHTAEPCGQGNTRLSHIKRRRLIMPLVALVQKKSQRTRNFVLSSGARRSLPRRRCSSRSVFEQVSACIRTLRTSKVPAKYNVLLARNITGEANNYTSKQLPPTNSRMMELQGITLSSSSGRKYLRYLMRRFATTY